MVCNILHVPVPVKGRKFLLDFGFKPGAMDDE
jgi:hypothetical protein